MTSPDGARTSSESNSIFVHSRKKAPSKVTEKDVRDALARHTHGQTEWSTPAGSIDVFTSNEVIEIKHFKHWKSGIGQVKAYGEHHPTHKKRLHLFAHEGEKALKYFKMATELCVKDGIRVTFEEVASDSNNLGVKVVDGTDVFGISVADGTGLPVVTGDIQNLKTGGASSAHVASESVSAAESTTAAAAPTSVIGGCDDVGGAGAAVGQSGGAVGAPMSIDPESGDGFVPPPPSKGASYGGPLHPIDADEADTARRIRIKRMKLEEEELDHKYAAIRERRALSSVPAAGDQSGVAVGAPISGKGVAKATKRKNKTKPKIATTKECDGVIDVVAALRTAFARAKGKNNDAKAAGEQGDNVYTFMTKSRIAKSMLPVAFQLLKIDKEYKPGDWFTEHEVYGRGLYPKGFEELVGRVENQIDGFKWSSWKQDGE